jgi:hypothetical protein
MNNKMKKYRFTLALAEYAPTVEDLIEIINGNSMSPMQLTGMGYDQFEFEAPDGLTEYLLTLIGKGVASEYFDFINQNVTTYVEGV